MADAENSLSDIAGRKGLIAPAKSKKTIKTTAVIEMVIFIVFVAAVIIIVDEGFLAMMIAPVMSTLLVLGLMNLILLPKYSEIDESEGMMPYEITSAKDFPLLVKVVKSVDVERDAFQEMKWVRVILEEPSFNKKLSLSLLFTVPIVMICVSLLIMLIISAEFYSIIFLIPGMFSVLYLYNYIRICKVLNEDVDGGNYIAFCRPSGNFTYMDVPLEMLRRKPERKKNKNKNKKDVVKLQV